MVLAVLSVVALIAPQDTVVLTIENSTARALALRPGLGASVAGTAPHDYAPEEAFKDVVDREAIIVAAPDDQATIIARPIAHVGRTGQPRNGKVVTVVLDEAMHIATGQTGEGALR
jgi:nitrogen regulatory protein PII